MMVMERAPHPRSALSLLGGRERAEAISRPEHLVFDLVEKELKLSWGEPTQGLKPLGNNLVEMTNVQFRERVFLGFKTKSSMTAPWMHGALELEVVDHYGGGPERAGAARYALSAAGGSPGGLLGLVVGVAVFLGVAIVVGGDP